MTSCSMGDTVDAIAPGNPTLKLLKSSGSIPARKSSLDLPGAWPQASQAPHCWSKVLLSLQRRRFLSEIQAEGNWHLFAFQAATLCGEVCGLALISG